MLPQEEIDEQLELLRTYRRTLATYRRQEAAIGEAFSPPAVLYGIAEARSNIQRIKSALRTAGVEVSDDIDDEEEPPVLAVPRIASRARAGLLATVIAAALLLTIGLALGRFGGSLLGSNGTTATSQADSAEGTPGEPAPSSTPSEADGQAVPSNEPTDAAPFVEYTFADGTPGGWDAESEQWQIVQDGEGFAYQAQAPASAYTAATPPDTNTLADLQNYAVEMRVKIVQADIPDDELPTVWLSLRAQSDTSSSCESYNFMLSAADNSATIYRAGDAAGCSQDLARGPVSLDIGEWHTIRAEVNDAQLTFFVDGSPVVSATDSQLTQGFFYITIGSGAIVQFADIKVYTL
jgi:hypothetical protein